MCHKVESITEFSYSSKEGDNIQCTPDDPWIPFDDLKYLESDEIDHYRRTNLSLTEGIFGNDTVKYYMDIYATEEFVNHFGRIMGETSNPNDLNISIPTIACIGTVLIMLFTSILFISYDSCVRKEFDSKERLLEAKRRFVRYVSHEVRTPLNTVCMGLTLVLNDLSDVLDNKIGIDCSGGVVGVGVDGKKKRRTPSKSSKSFNGNHSDSTFPLSDSFSTLSNTEDVVVLKRKCVEEWMSLSTQVYQNADAAVGVLSDLLNYDKIQMGTLTLELSLLNIWSALEKTVKEFKLTAMEKNVNLKLDFTPLLLYICEAAAAAKTTTTANGKIKNNTTNKISDSSLKRIRQSIALIESDLAAADLPIDIRNYKVVGDKIRLIQVFRNLISNGLKFSKEHSTYDCILHRVTFLFVL
jgi:signal transduction histidine kinase